MELGKLLGCVLYVIVMLTIGALLSQYVVDYWGTVITHREIDLPYLPAMAIGFVGGTIMIPAAIITWVLTYIIGDKEQFIESKLAVQDSAKVKPKSTGPHFF